MDVSLIIDNDTLKNVCKYRQGSSCCKYIVYLRDFQNYYCAKNTDMKQKIDTLSLKAKGDNCPGLLNAPKSDSKRTS